jgi:hypothetical protein
MPHCGRLGTNALQESANSSGFQSFKFAPDGCLEEMELNIKTAVPVMWGVDFHPETVFHPRVQ